MPNEKKHHMIKYCHPENKNQSTFSEFDLVSSGKQMFYYYKGHTGCLGLAKEFDELIKKKKTCSYVLVQI